MSSPDTGSSTSSDIYDIMLGDAGKTRGDISPGETGSGEGSGVDFTDFLTGTYSSEFETTLEGSGTDETTEEGEISTVSGITESEVTEETDEGSTTDFMDKSTDETATEETLPSGGEFSFFLLKCNSRWLKDIFLV